MIKLSRSLKIFLVIQLLILASLYIVPLFREDSSYQEVKAHWEIPQFARNTTNPIPNHPNTFEEGKTLFNQKCAGCHGPQGRGDGHSSYAKRLNPPAVTESALWQDGEGVVHFKIKEGLNSMPAFNKFLSDEQIWLVVNYMRDLSASPPSTS